MILTNILVVKLVGQSHALGLMFNGTTIHDSMLEAFDYGLVYRIAL